MSLTPSDRLPPELASALPAARFQILYFMRTADCAVCKSHVRRLVALQPIKGWLVASQYVNKAQEAGTDALWKQLNARAKGEMLDSDA